MRAAVAALRSYLEAAGFAAEPPPWGAACLLENWVHSASPAILSL
jgi:hypothetical protein